EALRISEEAHTMAKESGDAELIVCTGPGYWLSISGRYYEALVDLDNTIAISKDDPQMGRNMVGFGMHAWAIVFRGFGIMAPLGRLEEARRNLETGLALAQACDDPETQGWALGSLATLAWLTGEAGNSLVHAREAVKIAEGLGSTFSRAIAQFCLGQ